MHVWPAEGVGMTPPAYHSHNKDEWLTPPAIVHAARLVMGPIDLDPCSNSAERPNVPAATVYTAEDDGLSRPWFGAVFQNHPYSTAEAWVRKALREVESGNADQVIILDAARPDTGRFHALARYPVAFHKGRIRFIDAATGKPGVRPTIPSAIYYLKEEITPDDYRRFCAAFSPFCSVYRGADA